MGHTCLLEIGDLVLDVNANLAKLLGRTGWNAIQVMAVDRYDLPPGEYTFHGLVVLRSMIPFPHITNQPTRLVDIIGQFTYLYETDPHTLTKVLAIECVLNMMETNGARDKVVRIYYE